MTLRLLKPRSYIFAPFSSMLNLMWCARWLSVCDELTNAHHSLPCFTLMWSIGKNILPMKAFVTERRWSFCIFCLMRTICFFSAPTTLVSIYDQNTEVVPHLEIVWSLAHSYELAYVEESNPINITSVVKGRRIQGFS